MLTRLSNVANHFGTFFVMQCSTYKIKTPLKILSITLSLKWKIYYNINNKHVWTFIQNVAVRNTHADARWHNAFWDVYTHMCLHNVTLMQHLHNFLSDHLFVKNLEKSGLDVYVPLNKKEIRSNDTVYFLTKSRRLLWNVLKGVSKSFVQNVIPKR